MSIDSVFWTEYEIPKMVINPGREVLGRDAT